MTEEELQGQLSALNAAYADMLTYLLHILVRKGTLSPDEGAEVAGMGHHALAHHPLQGEVTREALAGFAQLKQHLLTLPFA